MQCCTEEQSQLSFVCHLYVFAVYTEVNSVRFYGVNIGIFGKYWNLFTRAIKYQRICLRMDMSSVNFILMCDFMICKNLSILTYSVDKKFTLVVNFIFSFRDSR